MGIFLLNLFNEQEEPIDSDSSYGVSLENSFDNQEVAQSSSMCEKEVGY